MEMVGREVIFRIERTKVEAERPSSRLKIFLPSTRKISGLERRFVFNS